MTSCVYTLENRNLQEFTEFSTIVSTCGRGGHGNREEHDSRGCLQCPYCKKMGKTQDHCYSLYGFPDKGVNM